MKLPLERIALWCGAELRGKAGGLHAASYSIDSRTLEPGALFFAVKGERFDGHDFIESAIERGACAAVIARSRLASLPESARNAAPWLVVADPLDALQQTAAAVRMHWSGRVIAITGSAGKTTTKEAIAAVLSTRYRVLRSHGNLNNHYGLPLQLLRLESEHQVAVIEMGMSHAGEIAALCRIARPDWGVVTNVGNAHAESFADGKDGIARAKRELIEALPAEGIAFLNSDDPYVLRFGEIFNGKTVYFGTDDRANVEAVRIEPRGAEGQRIAVHAEGEKHELRLQLLGRHNALNALSAIAVGIEAGIPLAGCCAALEALEPPDKRGQVLGLRGATVVNDCYNSNPEALKAMIATLASMPVGANGRRLLVAGEMLELGPESPTLHAECGAEAAEAGIDLVVGVRGDAAYLVEAARAAGGVAEFVGTPEQAGQWLRDNLRAGDAALLKASRGVRLERALEGWTE